MVIRRYFLLLSLLMAPAMVLPMGLGLQDGPEVVDAQAEQKRAAQEAEAPLDQGAAQDEPKTHYPLDCFPDDVFKMITDYIPTEDKITEELLSCEQLVQSKITKKQYTLLNVLAQHYKFLKEIYPGKSGLRTTYYNFKASLFMSQRHRQDYYQVLSNYLINLPTPGVFYYGICEIYPCDLSILARKHNIPVKELRAALDSFDPEIRDYIIKKYNIKTDWFYWCTRPAVLYSAAGVALAGLGAYLGWKYFKK